MENAQNRGKKRAVIILTAAFTLTGAGVAFAYWTSTGTGTGAATTGESVAFEITSEPGEGELAPGGAGQTVDFTVSNPGEGTQNLTEVTVEIAEEGGEAWEPTDECLAADYTAEVTTGPPAGEIAPGDSVDGTVTVTLDNTAVNQDDCQGQDVPLLLTAS
ncbi:hypothetical protein AB1046_08095 [Promicromonospora sp. Populi]|uniref:hypothetical protein n=1 Tax=Promicromonospora sp. Populi TaxID=3239420 RepID=UPI0034E2560D